MCVQTTSEKALRKQLQQHFKSDMNEKKAFIKEHVSRAAAAAAPAPRQHCLPGWLWTRVSQLSLALSANSRLIILQQPGLTTRTVWCCTAMYRQREQRAMSIHARPCGAVQCEGLSSCSCTTTGDI